MKGVFGDELLLSAFTTFKVNKCILTKLNVWQSL